MSIEVIRYGQKHLHSRKVSVFRHFTSRGVERQIETEPAEELENCFLRHELRSLRRYLRSPERS